jgi:NADH dehydrogenase (ubiquinone) 1 alpha/beta subcomplex 1
MLKKFFAVKTTPLQFLSVFQGHSVNKDGIILRQEKSGYYMDPNAVSRRFIKLIALHTEVQNKDAITLNSTWHELGINDLAYVEILNEAENEFNMEFSDDHCESFKNVKDVVEHIAKNFYAS